LDLGLSIFICSIFIGVLFGLSASQVVASIWKATVDFHTIQMLIAVFLILALGQLMKMEGSLEAITGALNKIILDPRIALVIPPALIGLLPTPGGAMLSAPMVEESGLRLKLKPEQKTYLNYWFRHLWEYFWPLYPGLIVASAILKLPIPEMMRVQYPLSLMAILAGIIFGILPIKNDKIDPVTADKRWKYLIKFAFYIWPIWLILVGLMILKLPILLILTAIYILMVFFPIGRWRSKIFMLAKIFSFKIAFLMISVMIFKEIVISSALMKIIPALFAQAGVSNLVPLSLIPFLIGLLTGVNQAYVAVGFPLLIPFLGGDHLDLKLVMFAYALGFFGVLLSPLHLCLSLTREYFNANWKGIYRPLLPSVILVFIASVILLKIYELGIF
jgi:integral membrane protein (TIGR00529 family)